MPPVPSRVSMTRAGVTAVKALAAPLPVASVYQPATSTTTSVAPARL
jgi:hypothetical protein